MGSSSFARFARRARFTAILVLIGIAAPGAIMAQTVSQAERDALVKLRTDRGGEAQEVDALIQLAADADAEGLPAVPLANKIREGLAKGVEPGRIEAVLRRMTANLQAADRMVRDAFPPSSGTSRNTAVTLLAEAIESGVTADEVGELRRAAQSAGAATPAATAEGLASAAKGLSLIKEARLPDAAAATVVGEAVRQGFSSRELLDLGREVKRHEADYRAGRASLDALRDAIARGDRGDQLFRDVRPARPERPADARPEPIERPARPEQPQRPEPPARPERPATTRGR